MRASHIAAAILVISAASMAACEPEAITSGGGIDTRGGKRGPYAEGNTKLHTAVWKGREERVKMLVRNGADVNAKNDEGATPLYLAAALGHDDITRTLLAHGAKVDMKGPNGRTALHMAVMSGHGEIIAALNAAGADASIRDNDGKTPAELRATIERMY